MTFKSPLGYGPPPPVSPTDIAVIATTAAIIMVLGVVMFGG